MMNDVTLRLRALELALSFTSGLESVTAEKRLELASQFYDWLVSRK